MNEVMNAEMMQIEKIIEDATVKQMMAIYQTKNINDATAMLATLYSSAKQSYRLHVTQDLGCTSEDIDQSMLQLDKYFLEHPEIL